jgi:hypothetical protein
VSVDLAKEELGGACCKEIGGAIPAYVLEGVEVICYSRNCCCNNGIVLLPVSAWELLRGEGTAVEAY